MERLQRLEGELAPMYAALPKNGAGRLDHSTVRYAVHRYLAQRHGWSIKGLEPAGGSWHDGSPTGILQDKVPSYVQELFEKQLGGQGLGLHDVAVLAATLEHLVHDDGMNRFKAAYGFHNMSTSGRSEQEKVIEAIDTFMMIFVLGEDIMNMTTPQIQQERAGILETYPTWNDTAAFVREAWQGQFGAQSGRAGDYSFQDAQRVVEGIQDSYGRWQDKECRTMKQTLLKMEEAGTGRVPLADFYGGESDEDWQFTESVSYLRELGALDERDPKHLRVLVANYMSGPNNCLASSGFYSVCCINECETVLSEVERRIAAPTATPETLARVMVDVPSPTVKVPRGLPRALRECLDEIAEHHGGQVPLHGRLFSQWLHHAYPRECPYPHAAGDTNPQTADEWMAEGKEPTVTDEERREHLAYRNVTVTQKAIEESDFPMEGVPWSEVEQLVHTKDTRFAVATPRSALRSIAVLVVGASAAAGLVRTFLGLPVAEELLGGSKKGKQLLPMSHKYCV